MTAQAQAQVQMTRRRFTVAEYDRMGEVGILREDERVELIAGEIIQMSPIGDQHIVCVNRLTRLLVLELGTTAFVSVQNPVRLSLDGEPQPDLVVMRDQGDGNAVPTLANVLLVIEVADSSRNYDRRVKLPLYAAAGIPEAWLVDLPGQLIERHSQPRDGVYQRVVVVKRGDTLTSTILPNLALAVDAVLP